MKSKVNNLRGWLFILLLAVLPGFAASTSTFHPEYCQPPSVSMTGQSGGVASFSWPAVSDAIGYQGYWHRQNNNTYGQLTQITATSHQFSGLAPGVYDFYFATVCGGETSSYIIIEDVVID